jgi:hypothetical protein
MTKKMTKKTTRPSKTATRKTPAHEALAMHSASSPDWGTPMILRRFAQAVLRPAAMTEGSIDLDYSTSSYWQDWWPDDDRPAAFLDGSPGRDVLVEADRRSAAPRLGTGFENPPGIGGGDMVQSCWSIFEADHRTGYLGSGYWVGFSVEQFGSLQNVGERNPLTCDEFITTIVPSRRAHYVVHPEQLIAITKKKQKRRERRSKEWMAEQRLVDRLRTRTSDEPVDAGAPSHLSYVTLLWHRDRAIRRSQMEAARSFLKEQQANPKSLFHKFEVIGPLELEASL